MMMIITETEELKAFCRKLGRADYVTVDTEFMREKTFWPKLCLVQLAGPNAAAAVDPLAAGIDLAPLFALMSNAKVMKVFHGARQDIEIFYHLTGKVPAPLFDTQIAAMVCGFGDQVGYETLVARLTGHRLDKTSRFTDWSLRPLTDKQLHYALGDVIYLREAYEALNQRIEADKRAPWLDEEAAALTDVNTYRIDPATAWQRLKPRSTDRRYLSVLRAIAAWRDETAMERDVPRNRVVRDESLTEMAAHPPRSKAALTRIRGVSKGFADGRMGETLIAAIEQAGALPLSEAPEPMPKDALPRGLGPVVDLLKVLLKQCCETHHVAQKLVASSADLEKIAADDNAPVRALAGWRRDIFGADALRLKHGKVSLAALHGQVTLLRVNADGAADAPAHTPSPRQSMAKSSQGRSRSRRRRSNSKSDPARSDPARSAQKPDSPKPDPST